MKRTRLGLACLVLLAALVAWWMSERPARERKRPQGASRDHVSRHAEEPSLVATPTTEASPTELRSRTRSGSVTVRAADALGEPLGGTWVCAFQGEATIPGTTDLIASGRTEDDGTTRLESTEWPESAVVVGSKEGFLPAEVYIRVPEDGRAADRAVDLRLTAGQTLSGRILDSSKSPIRGVRVTAIGIGYRRGGPFQSPPLSRAYPGSGWGSGTTDDAGEFRITGLGNEPCTLYLEEGWRFTSFPHSKYSFSANHPVAVPGSMGSYHAVREAFVAFRARDRVSGRFVNAYLQGMFLPGSVRYSERDHSISRQAYGLRPDATPYRGDGVYAFPVIAYKDVGSTVGNVTFVGYAEASFEGAIVSRPPSSDAKVPEVLVERTDMRALGQVSFVVPEDFPSREFRGLPFFVRFPDGPPVSASFYADGDGGGTYRAVLPVGDYVALGVGTTRQARSGPFQVGFGEGPELHLDVPEDRFLQLSVHVRDGHGRPLFGCFVSLNEDAGTQEAPNVAGIEGGATEAWPLELLVPRSAVERMSRFSLFVAKPGFRAKSAHVTLLPMEPRQSLDIALAPEQLD